MAFPNLVPTTRSFDPGNWPVKTFRSQAGTEVRLLYGNRRTGMTLQLTYQNITDENAQLFLDHYDEVRGSFGTFNIRDATGAGGVWRARAGWRPNGSPTQAATEAEANAITLVGTGNMWRYAEPPAVQNVQRGISTVSVKLVGVL